MPLGLSGRRFKISASLTVISVGGTWKARNAFGFTMSIAGVPERWKRDLSSSGSGLFTRYAKLEWQDGVLVRLI